MIRTDIVPSRYRQMRQRSHSKRRCLVLSSEFAEFFMSLSSARCLSLPRGIAQALDSKPDRLARAFLVQLRCKFHGTASYSDCRGFASHGSSRQVCAAAGSSLRVGSDEERRHSALQTTSLYIPCVWAQLLCSPCSAAASLPVPHGGGSNPKHGQTELLIEALRAH